MNRIATAITAATLAFASQFAAASSFTSTSPTGVDVTTVGVSTVGGIVVQLVGSNGSVVVSQVAASSLFQGYAGSPTFVIGTQTGFGNAVTGALGGGLSSASFRFTLSDGDTGTNDFDQNDNTLLVNGVSIANWHSVNAQETNNLGVATTGGFSNGGFRDNRVDTGWFYVTSAATLSALFTSIDTTDALSFQLNDADFGDNYYDFKQGLDSSLINVASGPVIAPNAGNVPEPASLALVGLALAGVAAARRRKSA